jgi:hypothetical protein
MGYDMRMATKPEVSAEDQAKAKELREKASAIGETLMADTRARVKDKTPLPDDHEARETEYWKLHNAADALDRPEYFRLNVWGMGKYAEVMYELGMLHSPSVSGDQITPWPRWDDELPDDEAEAKYDREKAPIVSYHDPSEPPTIPDHKFGSNDGWQVTPDEIRAALAAYADRTTELSQKARETIETDYWGRWIDYLTKAAEHGGFYVH